MKNMMYFLLCNIIIVVLVILTSCSSQCGGSRNEVSKTDSIAYNYTLPESEQIPAIGGDLSDVQKHKAIKMRQGGASGLSFSARRDTSTLRERISDKVQKNLIRWSISGGL